MHLRLAMIGLVVAGCGTRATVIGVVDAGSIPQPLVTARACTERPEASAFPVKVVLLVDDSRPMCAIDPPGSQAIGGFCSQYAASLMLSGLVSPSRVRALGSLVDTLSMNPAISLALVPFGTNPRGCVPATGFAAPSLPAFRNVIGSLQTSLDGDVRDYQGALDDAFTTIQTDITATARLSPQTLPRTRYVVMLVASGPPTRCAASDGESFYADENQPQGIWADSLDTACNDPQAPSSLQIANFFAGGERNQNAQLGAIADLLKQVAAANHVGDLRLHTVLLSDTPSLTTCGSLCGDLFGTRGGKAVSPSSAAAEARFVLNLLATRSGGTFTEFAERAGVMSINFPIAKFSPLLSRTVVREVIAQPLRLTPSKGAWLPDDDGDGVSNDDEVAAGTSPAKADTDGDGFDDRFELDRRAAGFDPLTKDARGCDPDRPSTRGCVPVDRDGDGLSTFAEAFLGSADGLVDSDLDGFPDGLEVRFGFDPVVALDGRVDSDADGVTDADELRRGSHPKQADASLPVFTTTWAAEDQGDGSVCYDVTIKGLPLSDVSTNLFKLWFGQVPESVPVDYGQWTTACFVAPPVSELAVKKELFTTPARTASSTAFCLGAAP